MGQEATKPKCVKPFHPAGTSNESDIWEGFTNFWLRFCNACLWENIVWSINKYYIFSSLLKDVTDIHRYPKMVNLDWSAEKRWC